MTRSYYSGYSIGLLLQSDSLETYVLRLLYGTLFVFGLLAVPDSLMKNGLLFFDGTLRPPGLLQPLDSLSLFG